MIIPIAIMLLLLSGILLYAGLIKKNRSMLTFLEIFWWLLSLTSAFFTGWAWLERAYSENWAMYGFYFLSVPIIIIVSLLVILVLLFVRINKIENQRRLEISFYLLLLFLAIQAVVGFLISSQW